MQLCKIRWTLRWKQRVKKNLNISNFVKLGEYFVKFCKILQNFVKLGEYWEWGSVWKRGGGQWRSTMGWGQLIAHDVWRISKFITYSMNNSSKICIYFHWIYQSIGYMHTGENKARNMRNAEQENQLWTENRESGFCRQNDGDQMLKKFLIKKGWPIDHWH